MSGLTRGYKLATTVIVALLCNSLCHAQESKIVFTKNSEIWSATVQGTEIRQVRQLTSDKQSKRTPIWSPDATKVAYSDTSPRPNAVGALVVIEKDGSLVGQYPIATMGAGGIVIDGMKGVDVVGWFDNDEAFAEGEVNPYTCEDRVIHIASGTFRSFGGCDFSVCPSRGAAAFWEAVLPQSEMMKLATTTGKGALFEIPKPHELPTLHLPITWDAGCTRIAFIDPRPPAALVVISVSDRARKTVDLPPGVKAPRVTAVRGGFVIGSDGEAFYNFETSRFEATPADVLAALQSERANQERRERIEAQLDAADADWWPKSVY